MKWFVFLVVVFGSWCPSFAQTCQLEFADTAIETDASRWWGLCASGDVHVAVQGFGPFSSYALGNFWGALPAPVEIIADAKFTPLNPNVTYLTVFTAGGDVYRRPLTSASGIPQPIPQSTQPNYIGNILGSEPVPAKQSTLGRIKAEQRDHP